MPQLKEASDSRVKTSSSLFAILDVNERLIDESRGYQFDFVRAAFNDFSQRRPPDWLVRSLQGESEWVDIWVSYKAEAAVPVARVARLALPQSALWVRNQQLTS